MKFEWIHEVIYYSQERYSPKTYFTLEIVQSLLFIYLTYLFIYLFTYLLTYLFTYLLIYLYIFISIFLGELWSFVSK